MKFNPPDSEKPVRPLWLRIDWIMLLAAALLLVYGVLFVKSACAVRSGSVQTIWLKMLFRWIPLGVAAHALLALVDWRKWFDWSLLAWFCSLALLAMVLLPGMGTTSNMGARRWLFGVFQPAEAAKIALIPAMAFVLCRAAISSGAARLFLGFAVAAVPAVLVVMEPDMGTALVFCAVALAMAFVSGAAPRCLAAVVVAATLAAGVFLGAVLLPEKLPPEKREKVERVTDKFIFGHWKDRILVFVHPERDPLGAGWNRRQSEIAVGSGGRSGKGYGKGTQNALGYLPASVSSSDFVFSVIAEETGFTGCALLMALFGILLFRIVWTGLWCRSEAGRLVCTGVATVLFVHVFVNVGMTIGLVPVTGIPLPLVSYGGTFTISTLALLGLVHSIRLHDG